MFDTLRVNGLLAAFLALVLAAAAVLATEATAAPGDPLPVASLSEVTPGDVCEARTVMKGTAITSFDVEIIEVAGFADLAFGKLIYFKVLDPDVAAIGVAAGMSGSPILCEIGGQDKVIGAISYGLAGTGPKGFATPIEDVLKGQPSPASFAARSEEKLPLYRGKRLIEQTPPLTVTGVARPAQESFRQSLERRGFGAVRFAAPAPADVPAGSADLAPGGALSVNYSYGDITIGAICTISYRDGDDLWACGHPLELAGQRSVSFSGAYIFDVLGTPWSLEAPFKLGGPTATQLGSISYDGPFAISGRLGRPAPSTPVNVTVNADGRSSTLRAHVLNEDSMPGGPPLGFSLVPDIAVAMAGQAESSGGGQPTNQNGRICIKQRVNGYPKRIDACSRFATSSPSWTSVLFPTGSSVPTSFMVGGLTYLLDGATYKALFPGALDVDVTIKAGAGTRQIVGVRPIGRLRAGRQARLRVTSADHSGKRYRQVLKLRIPKKAGSARGSKKNPVFRVRSGATQAMDFDSPHLLVTDNDMNAYLRYLNPFRGTGPFGSAKELDQAVRGVFHKKAALYLQVPWRKAELRFPLGGGGQILIGGARLKAKVLPSRGK